MKVIYEPAGRAREFAALAANLYRGCAHGCIYCYAPQTIKVKREVFAAQPRARQGVIAALVKDAAKHRGDDREILMSLTCDPYQPLEMELGITRQAIQILIAHELRFTVLTKGGLRAARDFDLLKRYDRCRFGTTLIFTEQAEADRWEPGSRPISERIETLKAACKTGIKTWVSLEPVIDPKQALELIRRLHPYVGQWNVGKLNYRRTEKAVDWIEFRKEATDLLNELGADYCLKKSLSELSKF